MEWLHVLLLAACFTGSCLAQSITTPPKDQVVRAGARVKIDCEVSGLQTGNIFQWRARTIADLTDPLGVSLYQFPARPTGEPTFPARHEIQGTYNFVIKNATLNDAGWYMCQVNLMETLGNLVVVEKPKLDDGFMFASGLLAKIGCQATYAGPSDITLAGDQEPKMSFYLGGKKMTGMKISIEDATNGQKTIKGAANYSANVLDHGKTFECRVSTQTPNFTIKAEQTFNIDFEPMNITIFSKKANPDLDAESYNIGDSIRCGAEGHPDPAISWKAELSPGPRAVSGDTLEILENMVGRNSWYCQANNGIGAAPKKEYEFIVLAGLPENPAASSGGGTKPWVIAVAVIVVLLVVALVVILIVYFVCYKKRSKSTKTEAPMSEKPSYENKGVTGDNIQPVQGQRPTRPLYANAPNNNKMVSSNPNPALQPDHPIHGGRDSPGFADLGTQQIRASNPELNLNSSFDRSVEHDQSFSIKPDAGYNNQTYQGSPATNNRPRAVPPPQAYSTNTEV